MSMGPEFIRSETVIEPAIVQQPAVPLVVQQQAVPQAVPVAGTTVQSAYVRSFAPDAWVAALAGLALTVIGLLAVIRGGFDGSMDVPVVQVIGFNHTTLLGLIEAAAGAALLISGASRSRSATLFVSAVIGVGAFVGAVQTKSFVEPLALERNFAWLVLAAAIVVALTTVLVPRSVHRSNVVQAL